MTNVEYTEFERLGMADASIDEASTQSVFPANTNVLYVGLQVGARAAPAKAACTRLRRSMRVWCAAAEGDISDCDGIAGMLHLVLSCPSGWSARKCVAPLLTRQAVERAVRGSMAAGSTDAVLPGMILNTAKVGAGSYSVCGSRCSSC